MEAGAARSPALSCRPRGRCCFAMSSFIARPTSFAEEKPFSAMMARRAASTSASESPFGRYSSRIASSSRLRVDEILAAAARVLLDGVASLLDGAPEHRFDLFGRQVALCLDLLVLQRGEQETQRRDARLVSRFHRGLQVLLDAGLHARRLSPAITSPEGIAFPREALPRRHGGPHRSRQDHAREGADRNRRGPAARGEAARHHDRPRLRARGVEWCPRLLRRRSGARAVRPQHARGRGRHPGGAPRRRRGRVGDAADPRAFRDRAAARISRRESSRSQRPIASHPSSSPSRPFGRSRAGRAGPFSKTRRSSRSPRVRARASRRSSRRSSSWPGAAEPGASGPLRDCRSTGHS